MNIPKVKEIALCVQANYDNLKKVIGPVVWPMSPFFSIVELQIQELLEALELPNRLEQLNKELKEKTK